MAVFPTATTLTAAQLDSGTAFPCSKGGGRNEVIASQLLAALFRLGGSQSFYGNLNPSAGNSWAIGSTGAGLELYNIGTQRVSIGDSGGTNTLKKAANGVTMLTDSGETAGTTLSSPPLTPAALSADQNDYSITPARRVRLATDGGGNRNVTGIVMAGNVDGLEFSIVNVGAVDSIILKHQSASSTAANRIICTGAADIALATNEEALLWYDGVTSRWRARKI